MTLSERAVYAELSPKDFEGKMLALSRRFQAERCDYERFHVEADELMCRILRDLGYGAGVGIFERGVKGYA
ncbi:hypothetical protein [Cloacibacillus porcorum]|uniref:hypothetical protein n=1 Tax=Cloacibacillus porcorum TaxID=1197717 RepID=UPI0025885E58|nr:hypothetical protein [Cloacibacillus porcorum]